MSVRTFRKFSKGTEIRPISSNLHFANILQVKTLETKRPRAPLPNEDDCSVVTVDSDSDGEFASSSKKKKKMNVVLSDSD